MEEERNGYTRVLREVKTQVGDTQYVQSYVLIKPPKKSNTCIVWVAGRGRYFSHTSSNSHFEHDLCGLDLPFYGRSYKGDDGVILNSLPIGYSGGREGMAVDYYSSCFDDAITALNGYGYSRIFFMCNSTAALIFQCWELKQRKGISSSDGTNPSPLVGAVLTGPFWCPSADVLRKVPLAVFNTIRRCFPGLFLDVDPILQEEENDWLDVALEEAHQSGRTDVLIDPKLSPTNNKPLDIEWICMVLEAQAFLKRTGMSTLAIFCSLSFLF